MAAPKPISRLISHVILDLDGTLLNTGDWELQSFRVFRVDLSNLKL
jgi:riboflavin kinase